MDINRLNHLGQAIGGEVAKWTPPEVPAKTALEGHTCCLEPLDAGAHARGLYLAYAEDQDGKNWTYLPYGPFGSFQEYSDWLVSKSSSDDPRFYAIKLKVTGDLVGIASYLRIDPNNGSIEVGHIHFSESLKQSVAATEAMYLMMKSAFELGYRRYEWKCDSLNAASCSAALRLGLSFEGVFRNATVYKGRNRDTAWFAAIDSDWPPLHEAYSTWLDASNFDRDGKQIVSLRDLTQPLLRCPASIEHGHGAHL